MTTWPISAAQARVLADAASEAIRALNHATLPGNGFLALCYPCDAYDMLDALQQLAGRLPQLLAQISVFLRRQLQHDVIAIDGGEHRGDPLAAIATATSELEQGAVVAALRLAACLGAAHEAIAFAAYTGPEPGDA